MADSALMDMASVPEGIEWQARHAEEAGAPGTAKVIRAVLALLDGETATGRRISGWQGLVVKDAMPLRIAGGLHNLVLTGADTRLADVYAGRMVDQASVDTLVCELVEAYDARLLPWLDGPPQTNEAGRSASLMAGLMWLCDHVPRRFEMLELGASAGINTMMERYHYDLGGVSVGPEDSPMRIVPEWRGGSPPANTPEITAIRGCDIAPVDLSDPEAAMRLKSYVWPEATARMGRIDAAVALAAERAPDVVQADAARFVEQALAMPRDSGTTRVLFHSIVWQYIPPEQQKIVEAEMARAAEHATADAPLIWLMLETNRETFRHELTARIWDGDQQTGEPNLLATAHPHGAWVEWLTDR
ncbi:DUF2332 domain-containing protein [Erythrobacter sp. W53]|uniref:DUF2332 domain-containing protein n=1 Tax=Erythrobacter sp. W53 TaxID=3425947 RepID=UPI003D76943D